MASSTPLSSTQRKPELLGQTVVVVGGSAGIGLETARLARAEGAEGVLTVRNPDRLHEAGLELGAASRPLTPLTLTGWKSSSMRCRRSITCWSRALVPTMRR
jgi:NADP-dependent 3-hydroxy acid dehydrogenase YdfG